ncbi:formylglycine-generating enzyme family protein [Cognatiyoonia sp. IB215182]|uniref:formylglycine-generating enzyme family protein n=1 Tax=Cognatiyoonia sp. IB215182 TaxID=3097353 RepID=UPI002A15A0BD|nr:formylglycine-generating enzyme family protein [Cognatiyoonia sp. IB215182]MDX8351155.1 formylglycine-generating enzyme family protein [Cognatiyoonia sp. IB215182]
MKPPFFLILLLAFFAAPVWSEPLERFRDCDVCPEMIELPLGELMMGAPEREARQQFHFFDGEWQRANEENPYIAYHEGPVHRVEIDVPYALGVNEVTYDEWMACVDDGGCNGYVPDPTARVLLDDGSIHKVDAVGRHPVMRVSIEDASAYVTWLNEKLGIDVYRLPTEAEWEYAARAGTQTPFAQGDWVTPEQVNFNGKATAENLDIPDLGYVQRWMTVPVDALDAANAWGFQHMSGNLREVVSSCWSNRHKGWARSSDYLDEVTGEMSCRFRISKGGSFNLLMDQSRVAVRVRIATDVRLPMIGFRVARDLER